MYIKYTTDTCHTIYYNEALLRYIELYILQERRVKLTQVTNVGQLYPDFYKQSISINRAQNIHTKSQFQLTDINRTRCKSSMKMSQ